MPILLAGADVVLVALLAVIAIVAVIVIAKLVARLIGHVPLIGPAIEGYIMQGVHDVVTLDLAVLQQLSHPIVAWIDSWHRPHESTTQAAIAAHTATAATVHSHNVRIAQANVRIDQTDTALNTFSGDVAAYNAAEKARVNGLIGTVQAATGDLDRAVTVLEDQVAQLNADAASTAAAVHQTDSALAAFAVDQEAWNAAEVQRTAGELAQLSAQLSASLTAAVDQVSAAERTDMANMAAYAQALAVLAQQNSEQYTDAATAGVAQAFPPETIADAQALRSAAVTAFPDIAQRMPAIPSVVSETLAGVMAMVGAITVPAVETALRCSLPLCSRLGGLGNFFDDLRGIGDDALLLALILLMLRDPGAVAHDAETVMRDIGAPVLDAFRALAGI